MCLQRGQPLRAPWYRYGPRSMNAAARSHAGRSHRQQLGDQARSRKHTRKHTVITVKPLCAGCDATCSAANRCHCWGRTHAESRWKRCGLPKCGFEPALQRYTSPCAHAAVPVRPAVAITNITGAKTRRRHPDTAQLPFFRHRRRAITAAWSPPQRTARACLCRRRSRSPAGCGRLRECADLHSNKFTGGGRRA